MPSGWENNCEFEYTDPQTKQTSLVTKPEVLHAETNAIAKVAQSTESSYGSTLFCTHAPCIDCAKLIYQSGINTVYYRDQYRSDAGLKFLELSGVNVHQHSNSL
jgi:dCMP deaminase